MTIVHRVDPTARMPMMSLICDAIMSIATADVNPAFTGPEIKSIKKPENINILLLIKFYPNSSRLSFWSPIPNYALGS